MENGVYRQVNHMNRDINEALRLINQNAVKRADQMAKGWAPGSWEEANLTHKKKGGRCPKCDGVRIRLADGTYDCLCPVDPADYPEGYPSAMPGEA